MGKDISVSQKIKGLHKQATALLKQGYTEEQVVAELCKSDISADYARTILGNLYEDQRLKKEAWGVLITGVVITVGSLAFNIMSYLFAERTGSGSFLLAWGLVVAGILTILKAISIFRRLS
jgi:hypothetical protein